MAISRTLLIAGPAKAIYTPAAGAATFFSKDDIAVNIRRDTFRVGPVGLGDDSRESDVVIETEITPEGRWNAALIAALWPHLNVTKGTGLFTSTDRPLVLHGADSSLTTIPCVALTKMPDLMFSSVASIVGSAGFTGLRKDNVAWATADSLFTYAATGGTFTDATYAASLIKTQPYVATLTGATGFTAFETYDGFKVTFGLQVSPEVLDSYGTMQFRYTGLDVSITCIPIGPSIANALAELAIDGTGAQRGRSLSSLGTALTIVGADAVTYLTAPNVTARSTSLRFGTRAGALRQGEVEFVAHHTFSSGVQQAICTLAAS
jgi:hypothetical protein